MQNLRLEQRGIETYIGGSEVAALLGIPGAYGTEMDVWLRRQPEFMVEEDASKSEMFSAGHRFEAAVMEWVANLAGAGDWSRGEPYSGPVVVGREPFMACHPDGYMELQSGGWHVYEGKLAQRSAHLFGEDGEMPDHYLVQLAWNMGCCNLNGIFGAQLSLQEAPWWHRMERDLSLEDMLLNRVGEWFNRHIVKGEAPKLDGSPATASYIKQRFRDHTDAVRAATEAEQALVMELAESRNVQKALEYDIARMEATLKQAIGGDLGLDLGEKRRVTWKQQAGSRRLDAKRLTQDHPALAAEYTVQGEPLRVLRASPSWAKL